MKRCYIIELGGEKEMYEMESLELDNIDSAILWIIDAMKDDSEYYNCKIKCQLYNQKYEQYDTERDFFCQVLVYIDADDKIGTNDKVNIEDIIESNLSIVSKITCKMIEVSD